MCLVEIKSEWLFYQIKDFSFQVKVRVESTIFVFYFNSFDSQTDSNFRVWFHGPPDYAKGVFGRLKERREKECGSPRVRLRAFSEF